MAKEASSAYDNDNYAEAARLWQQAIDQGYILSRDYINCLAYSYERINEFKKAIVLYKSVEARGDAYTLYRLGDLYYSGYNDGEDFQSDEELGKEYLKRAAEKGSKQALERLHEIEHSEILVYALNKGFDLAGDAIDTLLGDS
jgi:TPR repeat protein